MLPGLLLLLLTDAGHVAPDRCRCTLVEYNEIEGDEGRVTLRQRIFWDFHEERQRLHVTHYVVVQGPPVAMRRPGGWGMWVRTDEGPRLVESASYQATRTTHDPEIEDRRYVGCERRRGLR